jgi:D-alanyl-D-alanine dipeptidase
VPDNGGVPRLLALILAVVACAGWTFAVPSEPGLHASSSRTTVPPVSEAARVAGLLDVRSVVPDAVIDLRYATPHNFTGVRLYPRNARCLIHKSMADGLRTAANRLRREGAALVFWDCYRPHAVQVHMYRIVPDPNWVARPGPYAYSHEAARSVDVTLARRRADTPCPSFRRDHGHCRFVMGTPFDAFTARAHAYATGIGARARANRALLRRAMAAGGLHVYSGEWWHFDGRGSAVHRPILHVPLD